MIRFFLPVLILSLISANVFSQLPGSGNSYKGADNGYVSVPNSTRFNSYPFSITAWIAVANTSEHQTIYYSEDRPNQGYHGFRLQIGPNLNLLASVGSGGCFTDNCQRYWSAFLPSHLANHWIHIAAVFHSATSANLYLNGVLLPATMVGTGAPNIASLPNPTAIIGMQSQNGSPLSFFKGEIDEITLWNTALTENKVRTFMCKSVPQNTPGLVSYYKFDENSGKTIIDSGPAKSNGSIVNAITRVVSGAFIGDSSAYFYPITPNVTMTHYTRAGDTVKLSSFSGNATGIQVYSVNSAPNHEHGIFPECNVYKYFGIFSTNCYGSILEIVNIQYKSPDTTGDNIFFRDWNSYPFWENMGGDTSQHSLEWGANFPNEYAVCNKKTEALDSILKIPNVFSPNGDDLNDYFEIESSFAKMQIEIYNRWGSLVFSSTDYTDNFWDGKINGNNAAEGVYFFILNYSHNKPKSKLYTFYGSISLFR